MKKILVALTLTIALTGCLTTPTPVESLADDLMKSGLVVDALVIDTLSPQELDLLTDAIDSYTKFNTRFRVDPDPSYIEVAVAFAELRSSYKVVERIVIDHWDEYPITTQQELKFYQQEARLYEKSIQAKILAGKTSEAFSTAIQLGQLVVKVATL